MTLNPEFQVIITRLKHILLIKMGTINFIFAKENKLVYSCSIKIHALGFSELLESIFYLLLVMEAFSLWKVVKMLDDVVVGWQEVRWT